MKRLLRSTAMVLALTFFLPAPGPETIFVYKSAEAANSPEIPSWVAASCCGPKDLHKMTMAALTRAKDDAGWVAEGYSHEIYDTKVQPSQDGNVWLFYYDDGTTQGYPYCAFLPEAF